MSIKLRLRDLKGGGKSLYLDIYQDGQRSYEFLPFTISKDDSPEKKKEKITLANLIRSQKELDIAAKGAAYIPTHRKKVDFIKYYKEYLANYDRKDKRMVKYSLQKFMDFLDVKKLHKSDQPLKASSITNKVCDDFKDYLKSDKAGLTGETPQNYFTRFKKVIKQATKDGLFHDNPTDGIIFERGGNKPTLRKQVLIADELRTLAKTHCGNEEVKKAFLFACHTGLGMAEIKKLTWGNIDNGKLNTQREKTGNPVNIKLSDSAIKLIGTKKQADQSIFNINVSDVAVSKVLKNWVERAGIEKSISFYCGRHTYAVLLLMNGANLKTVSDAMGHTSTAHTIKYLNFVDSLKDEATSNLPDIL